MAPGMLVRCCWPIGMASAPPSSVPYVGRRSIFGRGACMSTARRAAAPASIRCTARASGAAALTGDEPVCVRDRSRNASNNGLVLADGPAHGSRCRPRLRSASAHAAAFDRLQAGQRRAGYAVARARPRASEPAIDGPVLFCVASGTERQWVVHVRRPRSVRRPTLRAASLCSLSRPPNNHSFR
jgi:hypothetical protein